MTAIEFLQSKRMLQGDAKNFVIIGTFGQVELTALLDEYVGQLPASGPVANAVVDLPKKRNTKKK